MLKFINRIQMFPERITLLYTLKIEIEVKQYILINIIIKNVRCLKSHIKGESTKDACA